MQKQELLAQANQRLKISNCRISILGRGNKLSLRGTLPPKPGKGERWGQQTISLNLYLNPAGVKMAEIKAQQLSGEIELVDTPASKLLASLYWGILDSSAAN